MEIKKQGTRGYVKDDDDDDDDDDDEDDRDDEADDHDIGACEFIHRPDVAAGITQPRQETFC